MFLGGNERIQFLGKEYCPKTDHVYPNLGPKTFKLGSWKLISAFF